MTLQVFARRDPGDQTLRQQELVLLEGSWSGDDAGAMRWALDDIIDGQFDWIDRKATDLAGLIGGCQSPDFGDDADVSAAYINALPLRYYLVKLLRVVTFFREVRPIRARERVELVAAEHDRDYAEVIEQLCRAAGAECRVRWASDKRRRRDCFPRNAPSRRWARRISRLLTPPAGQADGCKAVLCGSPRLLDPVCRELLARKSQVWWLYDRFAIGSWLRWHSSGVRQLVCDSSEGRENRLHVEVPCRVEHHGVNLVPAVERWLNRRVASHGARHTRLIEQIGEHFRCVRPDVLVLDEDATPMARAAVAAGRRCDARSLVVQHGAPCCRFGFTPLAADRIAVWGRSSQQTLMRWGVNPEQIRITGASTVQTAPRTREVTRVSGPLAKVDQMRGRIPLLRGPVLRSPAPPPRILLLATTPPRDERPDAVALNFNRRTYTEMLRTAFGTIAGIDDAELIVKLHPRASHDPIVRQLRAEFPQLRCRVVRRGPIQKHLADADVVLSCGSSAGIEAAAAGVPVIQLLPRGSKDFLLHENWGMLGTASCDAELQRLLIKILVEGWQPPAAHDADVFVATGPSAAARIAEEVISPSDMTIEDPQSTAALKVA